MAHLPKTVHKAIDTAIELLFNRAKARLLGLTAGSNISSLRGKRLVFGFIPELTLSGLFTAASKEEGVSNPNYDLLSGLMKVTESYLDATKERTKAQVIQNVQSYVQDSGKKDVSESLHEQLTDIWTKVNSDVRRIVETESTIARNMGIDDGIQRISAMLGNPDPLVFFVVVRDGERCSECTRLHLMPDEITPRVYRRSEVGSGYHKKGDNTPKIAGLHPHCVTGSSRISTDLGLLTAEELAKLGPTPRSLVVDNRIRVRRKGNNQFGAEIPGKTWLWRHDSGTHIRTSTEMGIFDTGIQECRRIELSSGHIIELSTEHEQWVDDGDKGSKIKAKDLRIGDKLPLVSGEGLWGQFHLPEIAELAGNLLGDGSIVHKYACLNFFGDDIPYGQKLWSYITKFSNLSFVIRPPNEKYRVPHVTLASTKLYEVMKDFGVINKKPRKVPSCIWSSDKETTSAFIRGLFAADGHVESGGIVLAQNDLAFLREIQLLLSNFGIVSRIYTHGPETVEKTITYADGRKFNTIRKPCWRLHIGGVEQMKVFRSEINFGVPIKEDRLQQAIDKSPKGTGNWRTARIVSISDIGPQKTYCTTEPVTNSITVNGIVTGNCRCILSSLGSGFGFNSAGMVVWKGRDWDEYEKQRS